MANTVTRSTLTVDVGFSEDVTGEIGFKVGQILAKAKDEIAAISTVAVVAIERKPYSQRDESVARKPRAKKGDVDMPVEKVAAIDPPPQNEPELPLASKNTNDLPADLPAEGGKRHKAA